MDLSRPTFAPRQTVAFFLTGALIGLFARLRNEFDNDTAVDDLGCQQCVTSRRLARCTQPPVVGHADWWSENLRWQGHHLHAVFDWDSITPQPEPILVGAAAYMFAATTFEIEGSAPGVSVAETERFLREYERALGLAWSRDDWEIAWAAGLWVAAYHAQLSQSESITGAFAELVRQDATERMRRAGA